MQNLATNSLDKCINELLSCRTDEGIWQGHLSSSALSTATAITALKFHSDKNAEDLSLYINAGLEWLYQNQNTDGGWGDTKISKSNISTCVLCWAAIHLCETRKDSPSKQKCEAYLIKVCGSLNRDDICETIYKRYGKDRTFAVPILTMCLLSNVFGDDKRNWSKIVQLPFELSLLPQSFFKFINLPVVSYALPALIAIGYTRHYHKRGILGPLRTVLKNKCIKVLESIQPENGGFLEATPLTSFVAMSLLKTDFYNSNVVMKCISFIKDSFRDDGSWPIDTNLSTWVSSLSINALSVGNRIDHYLSHDEQEKIVDWYLSQQFTECHPYTGADPGGWSWTNLPGAVPDADDTPAALLALHKLKYHDNKLKTQAAKKGVNWLLNLQNRDGGIPTFCKGWGHLPFDQSSTDLSAHTLRAFHTWKEDLPELSQKIEKSSKKMIQFIISKQLEDGSWLPLWFGNEDQKNENNPLYGTSKILLALALFPEAKNSAEKGLKFILKNQNNDGGWGSSKGIKSSLEETGLALDALSVFYDNKKEDEVFQKAIKNALTYLDKEIVQNNNLAPSPIGFYFAKLWYYEKLYPLTFITPGLERLSASRRLEDTRLGLD